MHGERMVEPEEIIAQCAGRSARQGVWLSACQAEWVVWLPGNEGSEMKHTRRDNEQQTLGNWVHFSVFPANLLANSPSQDNYKSE
jgi:hypothetical protein